MIVLSQLDQTNVMRGLITTLSKNGATIMPVSSPILYRRLDNPNASEPDSPEYGEITESSPVYEAYRRELSDAVDDGYAALVSV